MKGSLGAEILKIALMRSLPQDKRAGSRRSGGGGVRRISICIHGFVCVSTFLSENNYQSSLAFSSLDQHFAHDVSLRNSENRFKDEKNNECEALSSLF